MSCIADAGTYPAYADAVVVLRAGMPIYAYFSFSFPKSYVSSDILAYKQGYLQYHPPLTLAETASIFGEMIGKYHCYDMYSTENSRDLFVEGVDTVSTLKTGGIEPQTPR